MAKNHIVYFERDHLAAIAQLAQLHLDENGTPRILTRIPLSEEFGRQLREVLEKINSKLDQIEEADNARLDGK